MTPNSPEWRSYDDTLGKAPQYPNKPTMKFPIGALAIGPLVEGVSQGKLVTRWWGVYKTGSGVYLAAEVDGVLGEGTLKVERSDVKSVALTFDQQGRPIIGYVTLDNDIWLYWYNPVVAAQVNTLVSTGDSIALGFDVVQNTNAAYSDAFLAYSKNGRVYWRLQRDRWAVEYETDVQHPKLTVTQVFLTTKNTLQIAYRFREV